MSIGDVPFIVQLVKGQLRQANVARFRVSTSDVVDRLNAGFRQELKTHGFNLFYYHSKKRGELDFVVENAGSAIPIEVKSGKDYKRHNALRNVLADGNYPINEAIVLSNENVERVGKMTYAPVYMAMLVAPDSIPEKLVYRI